MMERKPSLSVPTHEARTFTWTGKQGVTEASSLGGRLSGRCWPDACDEGFLVRGRSATKLFTYVSHERNAERELVSTTWASSDGFTVVIFND